MTRPRTQRRFTLIEILMTVAITALIFAMIGGILLSVIQASENIEGSLRTEKAGYGVLATLRRDLTGVYAYSLGGLAFKGEDKEENGRAADLLHFVTTADVVENEDGTKPKLVEVGYRIGKNDDGSFGLYRRALAYEGDPLAASGEEGKYALIYNGLHAFDVEYLDPQGQGEDRWKKEWTKADELPAAVRVTVEVVDPVEAAKARNGGGEAQHPKYKMVVGIPAKAKGEEDQKTP